MGFVNKKKIFIAVTALFIGASVSAHEVPSGTKPAAKHAGKSGHDHSGKPRRGKASFYAKNFHGKKMADGTRLNPQSNAAASKTLPLGTTAKVTNLENGKSDVVEIRDRGPYVDGRIIDVTPKTAEKLGIKEQGVAPVEVKPLEVPQPDGSVKLGAAASETPPDQGAQ